ncbi:MAG: SAM-dependent methyltransferase, partial [Acidimicrobiales bacterium]
MSPNNVGEPSTSGASQAAIEHHYDVGTDFYRLWLDARMIYSCALWDGGLDDDLDAAQTAKLSWHASQAAVDGVGRVLDIGCG